MSPSGSESPGRGLAGQGGGQGERGFTLVEVIVAMVISVILGVSVLRFYKDSYHTYSQQEQIADRNQNAHYLLNKFVEVLQQAGSVLPDTAWTVITFPSSGGITIGSNPRGADQYNSFDTRASYFIAVSNGAQFAKSDNTLLNTTHILVDYMSPAKATQKFDLDVGYNTGGFDHGVKDNPVGMDSIKVTALVDLDAGGRIGPGDPAQRQRRIADGAGGEYRFGGVHLPHGRRRRHHGLEAHAIGEHYRARPH
jgi:prepilin-type N-terminal cleavage/methylation domain-containing protein